MNISLIGASGFVGSAILKEALDRGHQVKAIVRYPEKITLQHEHLTVVKADVLDTAQVTEAVKGTDAVISAYNPGWSNPNIYEEFLQGSKSIQAGIKASDVKRYMDNLYADAERSLTARLENQTLEGFTKNFEPG